MKFTDIGIGLAKGGRAIGSHIGSHKAGYAIGTSIGVGTGLFVKSSFDNAAAQERAIKSSQLNEISKKMRNGVY